MRTFLFAVAGITCAALTATAQPVTQHGHNSAAPPGSDSAGATFQREMAEAMRRMDQGMATRAGHHRRAATGDRSYAPPTRFQGVTAMQCRYFLPLLLASVSALAGQAPFAAESKDAPVSHSDRFYTADQFSNTVSVIDPVDNRLVG